MVNFVEPSKNEIAIDCDRLWLNDMLRMYLLNVQSQRGADGEDLASYLTIYDINRLR